MLTKMFGAPAGAGSWDGIEVPGDRFVIGTDVFHNPGSANLEESLENYRVMLGQLPAGLAEAIAIPQLECFAAALQFARTEGIVPAPEPTHAIAAAVREALRCKETGEEKVILTALCGHGHLDLAAYEQYLAGEMVDLDLSDEAVARAMSEIPVVAG